jgi:hypothetical protein
MGVAKRIFWVMLGVLVLLLWVSAVDSSATPIRPNLERILAQPQETVPFPIARAGWDGASAASHRASNPTLERIGPEASARDAQRSLKNATIPDYRAVAGIILVVLMLRRMQAPKKTTAPAKTAPTEKFEVRRAA